MAINLSYVSKIGWKIDFRFCLHLESLIERSEFTVKEMLPGNRASGLPVGV